MGVTWGVQSLDPKTIVQCRRGEGVAWPAGGYVTGTLDVVVCKLNIGQQCRKDCVRHCPELTVMAPLFPSPYMLPDKTLADQAQPE